MSNKFTGHVVALTGGGDGAKLAHGLAQILPPEQLTIIVNTGDDFEHLGLRLSPDLDKVMYTLAGLGNPAIEGLKNESWNMMAALARYSGPTWYQLGDRDLATQLLRNYWLREGYPLNWITKELSRRLGVRHTLLPMSEDAVQTLIQTPKGELGVKAYLAQKPTPPEVTGVRFAGAAEAQPSREVLHALREAKVIVFCPGHPLLSFGPLLAMPNVPRILAASRAAKIGVAGMGGEQIDEAVAKIMAAAGLEVSVGGMARYLREVLTGFVLDHGDEKYQDALTDLGLRALMTGALMQNNEERIRLAQEVLDFATG
ncbi:MAG: YvcK family protein [Anaerolineae bacterium]|nr:YvcK family protein [Anaerolineae bacterium]